MALPIIAAVFLGFARTFFLAPIYHYHLPNLLFAVHGTVFASWIALFGVQTRWWPLGGRTCTRSSALLAQSWQCSCS